MMMMIIKRSLIDNVVMAVWEKEGTGEEGVSEEVKEAEEVESGAGNRGRSYELSQNWMYEFLVQFLSSPIWRVSILDFVDVKCVTFDNEEENKFEYTTIHNVLIYGLIGIQTADWESVRQLDGGGGTR